MLCKELLKVFPKDIHYICIAKKDVSMIFRGPMDEGPKREMATPDSEIMLKNLDVKEMESYQLCTRSL